MEELIAEYVSTLEVEHPFSALNCTREQDEVIWNAKITQAEQDADEFWENYTALTDYIRGHIKDTLTEMRDE